MRISRPLAFVGAALLALAAARADDITDPVPGHPGVTYEMLLRQALPGLKKNDDGTWNSGPIPHFRDLTDSPAVTEDKPPQDLEIAFGSIDVATVRENGHERLLLLTENNSGGTGFDAVLAAYDLDSPTPKLLDIMDVGRDQSNGIASQRVPLGNGTDLFVAFSAHTNSNQSYELETPLFLRGGKFHPVTTLFVYGESFCSHIRTQQSAYGSRPDAGAPYRALTIAITVETLPGDSDCGDGSKPPRHSKHVVLDTYRWNAKTQSFEPVSKRVEKLSDRNWKTATQ